MRLEQEVKERETELEQAYTRLEEGEPPTQDAEQNWSRMIRTQTLRKQEEEMRRAVSGKRDKRGREGGRERERVGERQREGGRERKVGGSYVKLFVGEN